MMLPNIFAIETVLGCNLRCVECAIGANIVHRNYGMMSFPEFADISRKVAPYCTYAYLHIWGEPMLNPDIFNMIKLASTFTKTNISTNGNTLNDNQAKELILSGVSEIIVSIDGVTQSVYAAYRQKGDVSKAFKSLAALVKYNRIHGQHVLITPQFIVFDHNKHEMSQFYAFCKQLDLVPTFKAPYLRNGSRLKSSNISQFKRHHYADAEMRKNAMSNCNMKHTMTILKDGSVVPCCYDHDGSIIFGNIFEEDVETIYNKQSYCDFRNSLYSNDAPQFCLKNCLLYM